MEDTKFERLMDEHIKTMKPAGKSRPVERIAPLLARIQAAWEKHPDLRLGQIVAIATNNLQPGNFDPFYIEDEFLVKAIEKATERT